MSAHNPGLVLAVVGQLDLRARNSLFSEMIIVTNLIINHQFTIGYLKIYLN
jgi:hypothetical protein